MPGSDGPGRSRSSAATSTAVAVQAAAANLRTAGPGWRLARWDARRLPLADRSVDRVITNPPFGVQLGEPEEIGPLYRAVVAEADRVLRPGGRAVFLVGTRGALAAAGGGGRLAAAAAGAAAGARPTGGIVRLAEAGGDR